MIGGSLISRVYIILPKRRNPPPGLVFHNGQKATIDQQQILDAIEELRSQIEA